MNKFLKITLLFFTLAVPLAIFIFLRIFGNNQFDIPVFYASEVEKGMEECDYGEGQHTVTDTLLSESGISLLFVYQKSTDFDPSGLGNQYRRLQESFGEELPEMFVYSSDQLSSDGYTVRALSEDKLQKVKACELVMDNPNQYVLVDSQHRIRGYYGTDLDEVDRLIVEVNILLENGIGE